MKKFFAISLVMCALLSLLAGCGQQEPTKTPLTSGQALQIVLDDLDVDLTEVQPHIHNGDFQGVAVYFVYITVDGRNMAYAIDMYSGEILNIAESDHSH
jgi:uncharacterized membrane protein YkoI